MFDNVTLSKGHNNVATRVKADSQLISIQEVRGASQRVRPAARCSSPAARCRSASRRCRPTDYIGDSSDRTGFAGLEAVEDVTMLIVPDLMAAYQRDMLDLDGVKAVQLAMIAHCELMANRVAILDTPPGLNAQQVKAWRNEITGYDSKYATMYWPWVKVMDPVARQGRLRAARRLGGRRVGPQRRHPRRPQGTRQRGRPRRDGARAQHHQG